MPEKRATSRVERAIMLNTALKPDRMGAERARLLNKEQRRPFVVTQIHAQILELPLPRFTNPSQMIKTVPMS